MSNDLDLTHGTDLAIHAEQTEFTEQQLNLLEHMGVKDAPPGDLQVFFYLSKRSGLDPFARQIHMIGRKQDGRTKYTVQTGIDGYRLVARRAADHARHALSIGAPEWCDENGQWRTAWSHSRWGYPLAARITVTRAGEQFVGVANFDEYAQTKYGGDLNRMWATMPAGQVAKCAEALALRKAYPQDLAGLYVDEEMEQASNEHQMHAPRNPRPTLNAQTLHTDTDTGEVIEGEVVGGPAGAPPPSAPSDDLGAARADLYTWMAKAGPSEKGDRLQYMSQVVGRDVTHSNDLSVDDIHAVCDALAADHADFEAAGAQDEPAGEEQ